MINRFLLIALLLTSTSAIAFGQGLETKYHKLVLEFINEVKNQQKEKLAAHVSYPLKRDYPLADIKNKQAFLKRYHEVFDDTLVKIIVNSKLTTDWSAVGWRGIMLRRGDLWLDYDGSLINVNYQSKTEKKQRTELIKMDKASLYPSIRIFEEPVMLLQTSKYRIRIDDMGAQNYRYTSWPIKAKPGEKPDLIIQKGKIVHEGSGGNHYFEFKNGDYIYQCDILVIAEKGTPPASLTITKAGKTILAQDAKVIRR